VALEATGLVGGVLGLGGGGEGDVEAEGLELAQVGADLAVAVALAVVPVGADAAGLDAAEPALADIVTGPPRLDATPHSKRTRIPDTPETAPRSWPRYLLKPRHQPALPIRRYGDHPHPPGHRARPKPHP
jgi:hypothetical protein